MVGGEGGGKGREGVVGTGEEGRRGQVGAGVAAWSSGGVCGVTSPLKWAGSVSCWGGVRGFKALRLLPALLPSLLLPLSPHPCPSPPALNGRSSPPLPCLQYYMNCPPPTAPALFPSPHPQRWMECPRPQPLTSSTEWNAPSPRPPALPPTPSDSELQGTAEAETIHRLCPTYASDINSPLRHVRTRIYFTSESHIHSLLNVLRFAHLRCVWGDPLCVTVCDCDSVCVCVSMRRVGGPLMPELYIGPPTLDDALVPGP